MSAQLTQKYIQISIAKQILLTGEVGVTKFVCVCAEEHGHICSLSCSSLTPQERERQKDKKKKKVI